MNVVIRTDASVQIGSGHVMRCLTLAEALRDAGHRAAFVMRAAAGDLVDLVEARDFSVWPLPQPPEGASRANVNDPASYAEIEDDAKRTVESIQATRSTWQQVDWIVEDSYALDIRWERLVRPHANRIMVIDDLANRPHDCDLLLDQNFVGGLEVRYNGLVPETCVSLLGPRYALMRREFEEAQANQRERDGVVRRILVFFGGSDPHDQTSETLQALKMIGREDIAVDVVLSGAAPHRDHVAALAAEMPNVTLLGHVENMAELMAEADLMLGAGGATTWERCVMGLPSLTVVMAPNQGPSTYSVAEAGATIDLGHYETVAAEETAIALRPLLDAPERLREMSAHARQIVGDGGGTIAVVKAMELAARDTKEEATSAGS